MDRYKLPSSSSSDEEPSRPAAKPQAQVPKAPVPKAPVVKPQSPSKQDTEVKAPVVNYPYPESESDSEEYAKY